jgi:predicted RNA-binding protein
MCQATVYLDDKEIMRDVLLVEPLPEDIRLVALFEPVKIVPADIPD